MTFMPTPARPTPTPIWLGWLIDSSEFDVQAWSEDRRRARAGFVRRARLIAWATFLSCVGWQMALVRDDGGAVGDLFTRGDPALIGVGVVILVLAYAVGATQWWLHERTVRRLMRQQRSGRLEA